MRIHTSVFWCRSSMLLTRERGTSPLPAGRRNAVNKQGIRRGSCGRIYNITPKLADYLAPLPSARSGMILG